MELRSDRAGTGRRQPGGFQAFIPSAFPPTDLALEDLADLLEKPTLALGRLVGSAEILPNPDLFVTMYVRREAVLSSQIEGTEASLVDLLEYEAALERAVRRVDVREIANYVAALRYGMERVEDLPLSLRLIREIHRELMTGVRGGEASKTPGEFRRSQDWIGGPSPATARFVPPPPAEMATSLHELEAFLHADSERADKRTRGGTHPGGDHRKEDLPCVPIRCLPEALQRTRRATLNSRAA
jgi:Fic family protein